MNTTTRTPTQDDLNAAAARQILAVKRRNFAPEN